MDRVCGLIFVGFYWEYVDLPSSLYLHHTYNFILWVGWNLYKPAVNVVTSCRKYARGGFCTALYTMYTTKDALHAALSNAAKWEKEIRERRSGVGGWWRM